MNPIIIILIIIAVAAIAAFLYYQNNHLDITRYKIESEYIESRVRIAHLSDLHSKPFKAVAERLRKIKPDMIMITGDYINDKGKNKEKMLAFGKELLNIAPVYYITGNHERRLDYFDELMNELRSIGFNVLLDEIATTEVNGSVINILGLDENQANFEDYRARKEGKFVYKDVKPLFSELDKRDGFKIVLSHFPENFEMVEEMCYKKYDFDIQLSGHAHGGQFILPFVGSVFSPGQGLFPKYARGKIGDRPSLIISRGLGNAEFPFRLFNHPEIIVITATKVLNKD